MIKFYQSTSEDKRMYYASKCLEKYGLERVKSPIRADFVFCPINAKDISDYYPLPVLAGNIDEKENVFDYVKDECFALENAFFTAQGAIAEATAASEKSLVSSAILLLGFGRISKALLSFLLPVTRDITVCARNDLQRKNASLLGAKTLDFSHLDDHKHYDFIFNTVPHPILCRNELKSLKDDCTVIDLASFPGGVDNHFASLLGVNLVIARGLPGKYFPKSSGELTAKTVIKILKREEII